MSFLTEPRVFDLVAHLLKSRDGVRALHIEQLTQNYAILSDRRGYLVRVFRHPGRADLVEALIDESVGHNRAPGGEVFLVGGEDGTGIKAALPRLLVHPFRVVHLDAKGKVQSYPGDKKLNTAELASLENLPRLEDERLAELLSTAGKHATSRRAEGEERAEFLSKMQTGKPRATIGILCAIGAMFLLQELWAPAIQSSYAQNVFTIAMGALYPPLVEAGQWWRLISAGFLHGGLMHVGANSFVLYVLGGQLEKVLGLRRFVIIYTVALIGGSLLSLQMLGNGLSVGASGAIWGLLGAQVCLAYGRPPVLPSSIAESMRPIARQNLILNIGISFMANIDWAAHLGGGVAGAAVLISGALYKDGAPDLTGTASDEPAWLKFAAGACILLLTVGIGSALFAGHPWDFKMAPPK